MQKTEFTIKEDKELIKAIIDELPNFSRFQIEKMLKKKKKSNETSEPKSDRNK